MTSDLMLFHSDWNGAPDLGICTHQGLMNGYEELKFLKIPSGHGCFLIRQSGCMLMRTRFFSTCDCVNVSVCWGRKRLPFLGWRLLKSLLIKHQGRWCNRPDSVNTSTPPPPQKKTHTYIYTKAKSCCVLYQQSKWLHSEFERYSFHHRLIKRQDQNRDKLGLSLRILGRLKSMSHPDWLRFPQKWKVQMFFSLSIPPLLSSSFCHHENVLSKSFSQINMLQSSEKKRKFRLTALSGL